MIQLPTIPVMRRAFARKDASFDGTFFAAVKTTGIFCRPVCRAKPARPDNLEFFRTAQQALSHGYRPCKLCRPLDGAARSPELVKRLMKLVDESAPDRVTERDLRVSGIDPSTARRQFRAHCNMTFAAYQRARRMGAALREIRRGASVTRAQAGSGFRSASGFREAFARLLAARTADADGLPLLTARWLSTPLGPMVAVASDEGIALLEFLDQPSLPAALERLGGQHARDGRAAVILPGDHAHLSRLAGELQQYFAGAGKCFGVPLAPSGSEFERRAWAYLRDIPYGQTRSYAQQAEAIGAARGLRAVGRANGRNPLSILVPCHRVVGSNGDLTGYAGGLARKRWLLEHEQQVSRKIHLPNITDQMPLRSR
jgi:AraC family transcriptional regulator of adaptative response/methylated-DNA-[protein]-cysteine methyltransferase